jgi:hypothetical protein
MSARTAVRTPSAVLFCLALSAGCAEVSGDEPPLPAPTVDAGSADAASGTGPYGDVARQVDGGTSRALPTDTKPGEWTLNPDSAEPCPAEPPPIPIIGGACLGIYFGCGWTHPDGRTYSCVCDWVHWLCI